MKLIKFALTISAALFAPITAQDAGEDALKNMQLGMMGLQQAANDPVLLAQLMQDLQV